MKKFYLATVIILLVTGSCKTASQNTFEKETGDNTEEKRFIEAGLYALTEVEQKILEEVKDNAQTVTRAGYRGSPMFNIYDKMGRYDWFICRYKELDTDLFMKDPSADNILKCMKEPEDMVVLTGRFKGTEKIPETGEYTEIHVKKYDSGWRIYQTAPDYDRVLSWLETELKKTDDEIYTVVRILGKPYYVLVIGGKHIFYTLGGLEVPTEEISDYIKEIMRKGKEAAGDIEKMIII